MTRRIKANRDTLAIPIIALTTNATIEDRTSALAAGCDEFEPKPIDFERLLTKIDAFTEVKTKE